MKKIITTLIVMFFGIALFSQSTLNSIPSESYTNYSNVFNYTYWDNNWLTSGITNRSFTNQTNDYALNIDYTNLAINSLSLVNTNNSPSVGFSELKKSTFIFNYDGDISYAILRNGSIAYAKSTNPTNLGSKDSQMAEYGVWCNRRFISTNFTNSPPIDPYFTGVEFTNWHNRFKVTFHVKPTANITNGQLLLTVDVPAEYSQYLNSGAVHAFGLDQNQGFSVKGGSSAGSTMVNGNSITVKTSAANLIANTSYEVSILFYAVKENLSTDYASVFDEESEVVITANQTAPSTTNITNISYNVDEGVHFITIPRYGMGYQNCSLIDVLQNIDISIRNSEAENKRVRLCFKQEPNINVVGFNSLVCNANGDPSGLPLQVSKNWHTSQDQLYSGSWIKEYVELIVPSNTTLNFGYKRTGAKWGETYTASSHQLSVVGAGVPRGGWLEAALGSFGETITHSPDYEYGNANGCDIRPFLVTNQNYGGTSSECGWTGNVGGLDLFVYQDGSNARQYQSQVKTRFNKYSPNLTETSISAISADEKLKFDYTFYLNRSDDFTRVYYKINIEALQSTSFNRFDIFQLGGDSYNIHNAQSVIYGNDAGILGQFSPTNDGSNDYTTSEIALTGDNPWVWAGNGLYYAGANSGNDIDTNNAMIVREYKATFGGEANNTPYFRERSSSGGFSANRGTNPTSYSLVTPPAVNTFNTGDKIEVLVEVVILPKMNGDYYGTNENFEKALETYGNSYELLYRESLGNQIIAESPTNTIDTSFPLTVQTIGNKGLVTITGGKGYIPLVFSGLTDINSPKLWKSQNGVQWEVVDQSVHGKDFWQTDYIPETGKFDLVYNVNQDIENDEQAIISYYLGNNPPTSNNVIVIQSKINDDPYTSTADINVEIGDDVILAPQVSINGITTVGVAENWNWTGPNGFTLNNRAVRISDLKSSDVGEYTVTYNNGTVSLTNKYTINGQIPDVNIIIQSSVNDEPYTSTADINMEIGGDIILAPQVKIDGETTVGVAENWNWTGPNGYTLNNRVVRISDLNSIEVGTYTVTYSYEGVNTSAIYTVSAKSNNFQLIKRNASGFAIDGGNGAVIDRDIELYTYFQHDNMTWTEISREGGYYSYQKYNTNVCWDGGSGGANRQGVTLQPCDAQDIDQQWEKIDVGSGYFRLQKRGTNFSLDGDNGGSIDQQVYLWDSSNTNQNQHWRFEAVDVNGNKTVYESFGQDIVVYPNPVLNELTVDLADLESAKFEVINTLGQVMFSKKIEERSNQLNLVDLPSGIYFVRIIGGTKVLVEKIVKE